MIIDLLRSGEKIIYVRGDVGRPGAVPYRDGLSALQAIRAAGGFLVTAWLDSVILVRAQGKKNDLIGRKKKSRRSGRQWCERTDLPGAP